MEESLPSIHFKTESGSEYHLIEITVDQNDEERMLAQLVRRNKRIGNTVMWAAAVSYESANPPLTGARFSATLVGTNDPRSIETTVVTEVA